MEPHGFTTFHRDKKYNEEKINKTNNILYFSYHSKEERMSRVELFFLAFVLRGSQNLSLEHDFFGQEAQEVPLRVFN